VASRGGSTQLGLADARRPPDGYGLQSSPSVVRTQDRHVDGMATLIPLVFEPTELASIPLSIATQRYLTPRPCSLFLQTARTLLSCSDPGNQSFGESGR